MLKSLRIDINQIKKSYFLFKNILLIKKKIQSLRIFSLEKIKMNKSNEKLFNKNRFSFTMYLAILNIPKACNAFINENDSAAIPVVAERNSPIVSCVIT